MHGTGLVVEKDTEKYVSQKRKLFQNKVTKGSTEKLAFELGLERQV